MTERRTAKGAHRRDEVLALARRTLLEDGIDQFVVRRIAELAGMRLGNLQYYFPTRDELLEAIVRAEFAKDVEAVASVHDEDPERHLIAAIGLLTARWQADEGSIYLPIGVLSLHNEGLAAVWEEIYDEFYAVISEIVARIDPSVSSEAALARASLITSLIDGASLQHLPAVASKLRMSGAISELAVRIARGIEATPQPMTSSTSAT